MTAEAPGGDPSSPFAGFSHLDAAGRARMVDVGAKPESERVAVARGAVRMRPETLERIARGDLPKGDVFAVARVAGILAAKRVDELIPLCHPVPLSSVRVDLRGRPPEPGGDGLAAVEIEAEARTVARTGVEMEALAAVSVAALTVYDMCKAVDRAMEVEAVRLVYKRGGRSGTFLRAGEPLPPGLEEGPGDPASPVGGAQDTPGE